MAKQPPNHGKPWTPSHGKQFKAEVTQNTPTRVLGLHRTTLKKKLDEYGIHGNES